MPTSPKQVEIAERQAQVFTYAQMGLNSVLIGPILGVSARTVRNDLAAIRKAQQADPPDPKQLIDQYEVAVAAIAPQVVEGDHNAVRLLLEVLRERAEVCGELPTDKGGGPIIDEEALAELIYKVVRDVLAEERVPS